MEQNVDNLWRSIRGPKDEEVWILTPKNSEEEGRG
jgi:hypothetical protein